MKIYIASSWKNQHAVEMLTEKLRDCGHRVVSWVENNYGEGWSANSHMPFEKWMKSESAEKAFEFDVVGAMTSDLVIYLSPAGTDAWAEVGAAYGCGVKILGLYAKGEQSGLMRKMVNNWFDRVPDLMGHVRAIEMGIK